MTKTADLQAENAQLKEELARAEKAHPGRGRRASQSAAKARLAARYCDLVEANIESGMKRAAAVAAASRDCPKGRAAFLETTNRKGMRPAVRQAAKQLEDKESAKEDKQEDDDEEDEEDKEKARQFEDKIEEETENNGGDRKAAVATIARKNKLLHKAYLRHSTRVAQAK